MAEAGCARPTGAFVSGQKIEATETSTTAPNTQEVTMMRAQVGKPAPDFEAPSYYRGEFSKVKLSDNLGKWVLLCFYPGDFTYV